MGEEIHKIKKKVWYHTWLKWLALILFILVLICFVFKCCDNESSNNATVSNERNERTEEPRTRDTPEAYVHPTPIDTTFTEILPDDPLKREIVSNLVNAYCKDTVTLDRIAREVSNKFNDQDIAVTFKAEAYKRIQFKIDPDRREDLLLYLKNDSEDIKYALREWYIRGASSIPTDPGYSREQNKWFYEQIGVFNAWSYGYGSDSVVVAVLDDSFDPTHKELTGRLVSPWNIFDYSPNVNSEQGGVHGTHVAGTICANHDNGFGISGIAPNCKIMPIQIADNNGLISITAIIDGIFYALKNDADIINMSLGQDLRHLGNLSDREQEEISNTVFIEEANLWNDIYEIALEENTLIVQAAGNSGVLASIDPMKRSKSTIVVGATNNKENLAVFSNHGSKVDIYAPGVEIYSSTPDNKMDYMDGTSMATPIVSGCLALAKSKKADLSMSQVKELLEETGLKIDGERARLIQIDKFLGRI